MSATLGLAGAATLENARALTRRRTFFSDPYKDPKPVGAVDIGQHRRHLDGGSEACLVVGQLVPPQQVDWELHAQLWFPMSDVHGANGYMQAGKTYAH